MMVGANIELPDIHDIELLSKLGYMINRTYSFFNKSKVENLDITSSMAHLLHKSYVRGSYEMKNNETQLAKTLRNLHHQHRCQKH